MDRQSRDRPGAAAPADPPPLTATARPVRLALAIDAPDWHAAELARAAAALGIALHPFRLADAAFDSAAPGGLVIPGFADALPDAVLVRAVAAGSFEQVTRRLGLLHALRDRGVPVCNDARAIECCVDKSATAARLAAAGLPTPPSWTVEGHAAARAIVVREAGEGPLVCKPLFGAQGRGLVLVRGTEDLPAEDAVAGVYHLQRYCASPPGDFRDHRLFVIGGSVVAAMTRVSARWITNLGRGGRAEPFAPDAALCSLAIESARCIGAAYAGVDLLRDAAGHPWVLEVNSMPGWRGLQGVTAEPIARRLLEALTAG